MATFEKMRQFIEFAKLPLRKVGEVTVTQLAGVLVVLLLCVSWVPCVV